MRAHKIFLFAILGAFVCGVQSPAWATFHLMTITEVCTGLGGDSSIQYIELVTDTAFQSSTAGQSIHVRDADGTPQTNIFTFPSDFGNNGAGERILIATPGFAALAGITPDFTFPGGIPVGSGQIILFPGQGSDALSYGAYTGPGDAGATGLAPLNRGNLTLTLQRTGNTNNDANDYTLVENDPRNFAGDTGHMDLPECLYYSVFIDGSQETGPTGSSATGVADVYINTVTNELRYHVTFSGLGSQEIAAHIHGYQPRGTPGPIVHPLLTGSPKIGIWSYPPANEGDILAGLTYFNIHSVNFTGGEIRGQIDGGSICPPLEAENWERLK